MNIALKEANETDYLTKQEFESIESDINEIIAILVSICKKTNKK